MATNTIKVTARFSDNTNRTFTLTGVPNQEIIPHVIEEKLNAYNDIWGWQLPDDTEKADVTGYEEYIAAMSSVFISTNGAALVSLVSAQIISEEEVPIYNG